MIATMGALLRRQGYAATGWRQVIAESGTPWGSQAHHFPAGKQQLAAEAVAGAGAAYERMLRGALGSVRPGSVRPGSVHPGSVHPSSVRPSSVHPADAIAAWADAAAARLEASGWADGCPVATVALEEAARSDVLAAACSAAFTSWRAALTESITAHGAAPAEAASLATLVLAGIEGGLLLARAARDQEPLRTVGAELAATLRLRLGPALVPPA